MMKLEKQLKVLLENRRISVAELARKSHIPSKTLYGWLSGNRPRDFNQVKQVANFFGVSLDALVFGDNGSDELSSFFPEVHAGVYEVVLRKIKK